MAKPTTQMGFILKLWTHTELISVSCGIWSWLSDFLMNVYCFLVHHYLGGGLCLTRCLQFIFLTYFLKVFTIYL